MLYFCNKNSRELGGSMSFNKNVCVFIFVFGRVFGSWRWMLAMSPNVAMYSSFSEFCVATIHRLFCRQQSIFRNSKMPIAIINHFRTSYVHTIHLKKVKAKDILKWFKKYSSDERDEFQTQFNYGAKKHINKNELYSPVMHYFPWSHGKFHFFL